MYKYDEHYGDAMDSFDLEQREILKLSDKIRNDKSLHTTEKHRRYVDLIADFLQKHVPSDLGFVKFTYIEGFEGRLHLIMVKRGSRRVASEKTPRYNLESIASVIEVKGHGLVDYKSKLEDDVKTKHARFEDIRAKSRHTKCLYLTLQEREVTRGTNYVEVSRRHLGSHFFSLRESTTQKVIEGEWKRFVKALLDP
jgi:hypothetical protein